MSQEDALYRFMVERSQDWFWEFDENANFTYVSPRIKDLLGYDPEEVIGRNAFDLMNEDEAERVRKHFDPIAKKYLPFNHLENVNIHKDGHEVVLESSGTPVFDDKGVFKGYRGVDRDITERIKTEEALRKSQELLAQTQQIAQVGSWQLEVKSNVLIWSDETYRIFGMEPQAFRSTYEAFLETVHPDDRASVDAVYQASLRDKLETYEVGHRIIRADTGDVRHVHEKGRHEYGDDGEVVRSVGMVQDVTERKSYEEALLAATHAAESASRAKGAFLAQVSHEIRTPMTAIVGFGELLEEASLSPEHAKYLAALNASSKVLSSLIDDILDLSKVEAGELKIKSERFNVRDWITRLTGMQNQKVADKKLFFNICVADDVPVHLVGDSLRIKQVVLNLLGNAIKFTERGGIDLTVSVAEDSNVRILLEISVKDTGVGIPSDLQKRIFEPFVQGGSLRHRGAGLGLAISRSLAGLMGGTIRLESQPGSGSTFQLLVPLKRMAEESLGEDSPAAKPLPWSGPTFKVLLAEDNHINSRFIKAVLERMGHVVTHVENGKMALETLQVNSYDLVLMDIEMPVMNGVDALNALRKMEQVKGKAPVLIAMTAYALIGDKEKYLKMGFDGYLSKPFTTSELVDELTRVLPR